MPKKRTAPRNVGHRNLRFVPIEKWLTLACILLQERDELVCMSRASTT